MGKIKKILENELIGGTQSTDVYPVTSVKAVYNENNERLDNILGNLDDKIDDIKQGIIFDVSAHNNSAVFESLSVLLNSSDLNTLIPISVRHGGMSIRFIQGSVSSSDSKYVQYRLMTNTFSTDEADWQGVDDEPIVGSNNLVKSGGVANAIYKLPPMGGTAIIKDSDSNLLLNTTFTDFKYLDKNNGREVDFGTFSYTDYIDVTGISHLKINSVSYNGGCFYDEEKNYISGFGYAKGSLKNAVIEVPENAVYVRVNVYIPFRKDGTAYVMDNNKYPALVDYPWIAERQVGVRLYAVGTTSGYMADNGEINTSIASGGIITKYDVNGVKSVNISMSAGLSLGVTPRWCTIWVVDESDNPILMLPVDVTGNILEKYPLTIPENGVQLWLQGKSAKAYLPREISTVIEDIQNTIADLQSEISNPTNQWTGKKIVWLGTSIPYGQGTDGVASALTTYPMQVGSKLGATVVNVARPGMAIETTEDFKRKPFGSLSLTIAELASEGAAITPYQSYENAMLRQDADLYIFDCEPNNSNWDLTDLENFSVANWAYNDSSTFESHRNSYVGALLFLLDKLWTEKPSAKVVFVSEFISGANLDDKYEGLTASKAVAEKLRIPLINVASKLYYTPLNKSLYLNSDNVHPKQATHDRIANILAQELLTVS